MKLQESNNIFQAKLLIYMYMLRDNIVDLFSFSLYKLLLYMFSTEIMRCNYFMWADHHLSERHSRYTYLSRISICTHYILLYKNTFCVFFSFFFIMAVCSLLCKSVAWYSHVLFIFRQIAKSRLYLSEGNTRNYE